MGNTDQTIRVSARGEFGQLERGLKDLQKDFGSVSNEINKGARKGGVFDDTSLRALDIYKRRFLATYSELEKEFERQNKAIDSLHNKMAKSSEVEKMLIREKIKEREKELDVIRKQLYEIERMYQKKMGEASTYETHKGGGKAGSTPSGGESFVASAAAKALGVVGGVAKFAAGLAGITGVVGLARKAYELAYNREVASLDLAQRIRSKELGGPATSMYDKVSEVGRRNNLGYSPTESWAVQEAYTSKAGRLSLDEQYSMQKFARSYGLESTEVASSVGSIMQIGGTTSPKAFTDMLSGSITRSGMTPRILEVLQSHTVLLQNLNTSFKGTASATILAYQTALDKAGTDSGMTRLTGAQGANIIGGLGGVFQPGSDAWKWMGVTALKEYNPQKYGNMGLYELERSFEGGLLNTDNLPAMAGYLRKQSGGNETVYKRFIQNWLQQGGFNATKEQVDQLNEATNGFTVFDKDKIEGIIGSNSKADGGANYDNNRKGETGQEILQVNAELDKNLQEIGSKLIGSVLNIEQSFSDLLDLITSGGTPEEIAEKSGEIISGTGLDYLIAGTAGIYGIKAANSIRKRVNSRSQTANADDIFDDGLHRAADTEEGKAKNKKQAKSSKEAAKDAAKERQAAKASDYVRGSLDSNEISKLKELAGGDPKKLEALTEHYKLNGNIKATEAFAKGSISGGAMDVLEELAEGDAKKLELLKAEYIKTGNLDLVASRAGSLGVSEISKGKKALKMAGSLTNSLPVVDGLVDFGINKAMGADTKEATARAVGSTVVGAIGTAVGGIVTLPGGGTGAIPGSIIGGIAGDQAGKKFYEVFLKDTNEFSSEAISNTRELANKGVLSLEGLSGSGLSKLTALQSIGQLQFTQLSKEGSVSIKNLSKSGAESLLKMQQNGEAHFGTIQASTVGGLNIVVEEHKDFKRQGLSILRDMSDTLKGTAVEQGVTGRSTTSEATLNGKLGGVLKGHGDDFIRAGERYGIDPAFIAAIAMHETGNGTSSIARNKNNVGGMMGKNGAMTFSSVEEGIDAMASNLYRLYIKEGLTTPEAIQRKYAPVGAANDPGNLNRFWLPGVNRYWKELGGGQSSNVTLNAGSSFFKGWNSRVTSSYGERRGSSTHWGLDIDGEQGDQLNALAGGKIEFINMDDGSSYDSDKKANTRAGGTEIGVRMSNGNLYSYSHLSKINPQLYKQWFMDNQRDITIGQNDYVGNVGGDVGRLGSGYSTTGSHLHLGYKDSRGNSIDPKELLNSLNRGSSDLDRGPAQTSFKVSVDVNLQGSVQQLNDVTAVAMKQMLEQIVRRTVEEMDQQKLAMGPSIRGVQ